MGETVAGQKVRKNIPPGNDRPAKIVLPGGTPAPDRQIASLAHDTGAALAGKAVTFSRGDLLDLARLCLHSRNGCLLPYGWNISGMTGGI